MIHKIRAAHKYVHKRVLIQLYIFVVAVLVVLGVVSFDLIQRQISLPLAFLGLVTGILIGFVAALAARVKWHEESQKVILTRDKLSILLIALYIILRISSRYFFNEFIPNSELSAFTYSSLGGLMLGRLLGIMNNINKVLKLQQIF
ncbi:hypothetical protein M1563_04705 [Patescibacteria group bacterium]|nr:hypothetical protein [Patescibacteria group bacterium]MCL5409545.1 hypothetical protein [Patescibacteria group bacterium]